MIFFSSRTLFARRNMKFNFICTNLMFGWILKTFWTLMQYIQTARSRFPLVSIREITLSGLKQTYKSIAWMLFKVSQYSQCHEYIIWSLFNASLLNMIIYVIYTFCKINNTQFVSFCIRTNIFNHCI